MKTLTLTMMCLLSSQVFSQMLTAEQVKADLDTVISMLTEVHPTFNTSPNKKVMIAVRDTINTSMTSHDLFRMLQPLVAVDGHTTLQFMGAIDPDVTNPLLPFEAIVHDNRLYVNNNLSENTLLEKGTEVIAINGKEVKDILMEMLPYLPGERIENKIRKLRNEAFPNWYRLVNGNFEHFELEVAGPFGIQATTVEGAHWKQFPRHEDVFLKLSFPESWIACLKVDRFRRPDDFLHYIDSSFTEIQNRQIKHLIIDVTEGGGFSDLADSLLSFITDKPYCNTENRKIRISRQTKDFIEGLKEQGMQEGAYFVLSRKPEDPVKRSNRFNGKVYVLAGPRTYSTSTMFAAMAKCYSDAIIVGEETGMPLISNGDITRIKLTHSGMNLYSSMSVYHLPCAENEQDGVKPDIEVKMSLEDLLNGTNSYLEYTIDSMKNSPCFSTEQAFLIMKCQQANWVNIRRVCDGNKTE